jgi:hypothetical protein
MGFKGTPWSKDKIVSQSVSQVSKLGCVCDPSGKFNIICIHDDTFSVRVPLINGKSCFTIVKCRRYDSIWLLLGQLLFRPPKKFNK